MRVYLDTCVLNRLTDPLNSARLVMESLAVNQLFLLVQLGRIEWAASIAVDIELQRNPDQIRREEVRELMAYASELVQPNANTVRRARELRALGYGSFDGFHLALAEQAMADVLLTTDDRFLRLAARRAGEPKVELANPVEWLRRMKLWQS